MKKKCEGSQHKFNEDGKCTICGRTKNVLWMKSMEEDMPCARSSKSIYEIERDSGHGFWGNSTTGYIYDKDLKEETRYKE